MSKLNFLVYLNTYSDPSASNNPSLSNFKWAREITGIPASNPISEAFSLAPGETKTIFSGLRTLLADGTTTYNLTLKPLSSSNYRLSWASGTLPGFRTLRSIGTNALTAVTAVVNGPIVTFSAPGAPGVKAAYGPTDVPGQTSTSLWQADNVGVAGNSIIITGDGTKAFFQLQADWNTANPGNTVTQMAGNSSQIPNLGASFTLSGGDVSTAASFVGSVATTITGLTLQAVTAGAAGNAIVLNGNGTQDVDTLISVWNGANPSNQVACTAGDHSQIPNNGQVLQLAGGVDAAAALNTAAVVIGDEVRIGDQFNALNQGKYKVIAKATNSITVENFVGVNEGPIVLGSGFANQIRIYSTAGVQEDDTIVIKSGFSPVTFGSYKVTDVTDTYVEFYSTDTLPVESGIISADLAVYSAAKNLVYLESDQKTTVNLNGIQMASMEPFIINNSRQPGVFMLKATVYSFAVTNNSLETASCFIATVE